MTSRNTQEHIKELALDILFLLVILLAGLKFTWGLEQALDIKVGDDVWYMFRGIHIHDQIPPASASPLYSLFYYIVWRIFRDAITTYYFSIKLLTILPSLFLYIALRKNRVRILLSAAVSVLFLVSQMNFPSWPKVSHFAVVIMLGTLALIRNRAPLNITMAIAAFSSLAISYVRPEYFLSFLIFAAVCLAASAVRFHKERKPAALLPLLILAVSFSIVPLAGQPAFDRDDGREIFAFGQHFSMNWARWTNSRLDPMRDWEQITMENFGDSRNIKEAALNNPRMVIKHVVYNTARFAAKPIRLASPYPLEITATPLKFTGLFTLSLLGFYIFRIRKRLAPLSKQAWLEHKQTFIVMLIFSIPGVLSCILIYPRDHYMTMLGVLALAGFAMVISPDFPTGIRPFSSIAGAVILLLIVPPLASLMSDSTDNRLTINKINSLNIQKPIRILAFEEQYPPFINTECTNITSHSKNSDFDTFLKDRDINIIVLSPNLIDHPKFADDAVWGNFISNYESYGFSSIPVTGSGNSVLISDSTMDSSE